MRASWSIFLVRLNSETGIKWRRNKSLNHSCAARGKNSLTSAQPRDENLDIHSKLFKRKSAYLLYSGGLSIKDWNTQMNMLSPSEQITFIDHSSAKKIRRNQDSNPRPSALLSEASLSLPYDVSQRNLSSKIFFKSWSSWFLKTPQLQQQQVLSRKSKVLA